MKTNLLNVLNALLLGAWLSISDSVAIAQTVQLTKLVDFFGTNGATPYAGLTAGPDGNLYGTTYGGGNNDYGTVFRVTTDGMLTTLHFFTNGDGVYPYAELTLGPDGNFYGTTIGGGNGGNGSVFQVTTNGMLTTLHFFTGADGAEPYAGLTLGNDGNFYGTTEYGGEYGSGYGYGTVFQVTTSGTLTTLHSFTGDGGANPRAGLTLGNDGSFYGTTGYGGSNENGTVFKITTNGTLTQLHSFSALVGPGGGTNADGVIPTVRLALGNDGNFYGTTLFGGSSGNGTVFKVTTNRTLTTLHAFSAGAYYNDMYFTNADGAIPRGALTLGNDGCFYGTTWIGGGGGYGTVFRLTTNGTLTTFYSFSTTDVGSPNAGVTLGPDGSFYGTTGYGGGSGNGTVFKLSILPVRLNLQLLLGDVVLSWTDSTFSLQAAPKVTGTYTNILGATSPYTNAIVNECQFFRLIGN